MSNLKLSFISLVLFLSLNCFCQKSIIELVNENLSYNNKIDFKIINNDSLKIFYNVQLEKYDFINNEYYNYSKDVFSKPFNPLELTLYIEPLSEKKMNFLIDFPEWIDKKADKKGKINQKKGVFRFKLIYGIDEWHKDKIVYSKDFIIK